MEEAKPLKQQSNRLLNGIVVVAAILGLGVIAFSIWRVLDLNQMKEDISQIRTDCIQAIQVKALILGNDMLNKTFMEGYSAGVSNTSKYYYDNLNATIAAAQIATVNQLCQRTPNPLANEQVFIGNRTMALCDYVAIRGG